MSIAPTAGDGYAAWSQARPDMSLEVQVVDVATGVTRRLPWRNVAFPRIVDGLLLAVSQPSSNWHATSGAYRVAFDLHTLARVPLPAGNPIECDHGRLKARLRPMRGPKRHRSAQIIAAGHGFVQNARRGPYEIATDAPEQHRLTAVFTELAMAI